MRISIEAGTIDSENRKVIEENRSRQCRENFFSPRKKPLFLFLPFSFLLLIDAIPRFIDISRVAGIIEQALSKRGNTILGENTPNSSRAERIPLRCSDLSSSIQPKSGKKQRVVQKHDLFVEFWKFGAETKTGQDRFSARDRLRNNRSLV